MKKYILKDIMSQPVITIDSEADFHKVEEIFIDNNFRHLPIVDENTRLVGLITKRDLFRIISPRRDIQGIPSTIIDQYIELKAGFYLKDSLDSFILRNVMVKEVVTLSENRSVSSAIEPMINRKIGCIVIVDTEKKPIGIVTRFDILKLTNELLNEAAREK